MTTGSTGENGRIAVEYLRAMAAGDMPALDRLLDPGMHYWVPGDYSFSGLKDADEHRAGVLRTCAAFPEGFSIEPTRVLADGEWVTVEARSSGVHTNGRVYENLYAFLIQVRDGRVLEVR